MIVRQGQVRKVKGVTTHLSADGDLTDAVVSVEIHKQDGMYCIFRYDCDGKCIADTVQFSLDDAVAEAEYEYDLSWQE